jgi:hypothetical protein
VEEICGRVRSDDAFKNYFFKVYNYTIDLSFLSLFSFFFQRVLLAQYFSLAELYPFFTDTKCNKFSPLVSDGRKRQQTSTVSWKL